jgi:hypothetical protein
LGCFEGLQLQEELDAEMPIPRLEGNFPHPPRRDRPIPATSSLNVNYKRRSRGSGGELSSHLPLSPSKLDEAAKPNTTRQACAPFWAPGVAVVLPVCVVIEEERESWKSRSLPPWSKANRPLRSAASNRPW